LGNGNLLRGSAQLSVRCATKPPYRPTVAGPYIIEYTASAISDASWSEWPVGRLTRAPLCTPRAIHVSCG
jgi:hypothetical protein